MLSALCLPALPQEDLTGKKEAVFLSSFFFFTLHYITLLFIPLALISHLFTPLSSSFSSPFPLLLTLKNFSAEPLSNAALTTLFYFYAQYFPLTFLQDRSCTVFPLSCIVMHYSQNVTLCLVQYYRNTEMWVYFSFCSAFVFITHVESWDLWMYSILMSEQRQSPVEN